MTGANVLVAIFAEGAESHAAFFLQEQVMTRYDAVNYISSQDRQAAWHDGPFEDAARLERSQIARFQDSKKGPEQKKNARCLLR